MSNVKLSRVRASFYTLLRRPSRPSLDNWVYGVGYFNADDLNQLPRAAVTVQVIKKITNFSCEFCNFAEAAKDWSDHPSQKISWGSGGAVSSPGKGTPEAPKIS